MRMKVKKHEATPPRSSRPNCIDRRRRFPGCARCSWNEGGPRHRGRRVRASAAGRGAVFGRRRAGTAAALAGVELAIPTGGWGALVGVGGWALASYKLYTSYMVCQDNYEDCKDGK